MATVFPKKALNANSPVDSDEVNANFQEVIQEVQGNLGEHNWKEGAFSAVADVTEGAVVRCYRATQPVEWYDPARNGSKLQKFWPLGVGLMDAALPSSAFKVSHSHEWQTIKSDDGSFTPMEITITSDNSLLWIVFSCQMDFASSEETDAGTYTYESTVGTGTNLPGFQVAISVDGSVVSETITGSLDRANDPTGEGIHYLRTPLSIDCVFPVMAGSHTIAAKIRTAYGSGTLTQLNSTTDFYAVFTRELFIVEMR